MPAQDVATQDALLQEIHEGFKAFKTVNDALQAEVKQYGTASGELKTKTERIQTALDQLETKLAAINDAAAAEKNRANELQTKLDAIYEDLKRKGTAPSSKDELVEQAAQAKDAYFKYLRWTATTGNGRYGKSLEDHMGPEGMKALIRENDQAGGYLVPVEYVAQMLVDQREWTMCRPYASIRTTSGPAIRMPKRKTVAAATWTGETETRSETTNPSFELLEIPVHEMTALVKVSVQEMEDAAFNLDAWLRGELAEAFGVTEGTAFTTGNGVKKPAGFTLAPGATTVGSGGSGVITADALINLFHSPKEAYGQNGTFAMNRGTLRVIRTLKIVNDGQYVWAPGIQRDGRPATILDRPYFTSPDMPGPTAGDAVTFTAGDKIISYGDFRRGFMIVDRVDMNIIVDPYSSKAQGMIEMSARKRVGGSPLIVEAIHHMTVNS